MTAFLAFFLSICTGATCYWSAPIRDQATADQMRQDASMQWYNRRVEVWAVQCRQVSWSPTPALDVFYRVQSPQETAIGCERELVAGDVQ